MKELCPNTTHGEEAQTQDESTNREKSTRQDYSLFYQMVGNME